MRWPGAHATGLASAGPEPGVETADDEGEPQGVNQAQVVACQQPDGSFVRRHAGHAGDQQQLGDTHADKAGDDQQRGHDQRIIDQGAGAA